MCPYRNFFAHELNVMVTNDKEQDVTSVMSVIDRLFL